MVGTWEWVLIILVIVLLFGAKRIPEIAKGLGQGIRAFKKELHGDSDTAKQENSGKQDTSSTKRDDAGPAAL